VDLTVFPLRSVLPWIDLHGDNKSARATNRISTGKARWHRARDRKRSEITWHSPLLLLGAK